EAFEQWTSTDSIYGARHLAEFWEHNPDPATVAALSGATEHRPELERVELMVLMDLIGAPDNMFAALQIPTADIFTQLSKLEKRLQSAEYIDRLYMNTAMPPGAASVEDDHLPFIERNIPVLHLISVPFPRVWHTLSDNAEALDATDKAAAAKPTPVDSTTSGGSLVTPAALSNTGLLGRLLSTLLAVALTYTLVMALWHRRA
ncbi:hypothetical protein GGF45_002756, partial [Coemansia sp. RSA 551]